MSPGKSRASQISLGVYPPDLLCRKSKAEHTAVGTQKSQDCVGGRGTGFWQGPSIWNDYGFPHRALQLTFSLNAVLGKFFRAEPEQVISLPAPPLLPHKASIPVFFPCPSVLWYTCWGRKTPTKSLHPALSLPGLFTQLSLATPCLPPIFPLAVPSISWDCFHSHQQDHQGSGFWNSRNQHDGEELTCEYLRELVCSG